MNKETLSPDLDSSTGREIMDFSIYKGTSRSQSGSLFIVCGFRADGARWQNAPFISLERIHRNVYCVQSAEAPVRLDSKQLHFRYERNDFPIQQ